ncbi:MAG: hypothetical protein LBQ60_07110 [Bacteroidales bacterium]|jgi:hypothetical protein|nr:hypothetical protein [Bacteroidales bacterium]
MKGLLLLTLVSGLSTISLFSQTEKKEEIYPDTISRLRLPAIDDSIFFKYSLNDSLDLSNFLSPKSELKPFHPEKEKLSYHPEKNITRHPLDGMPIYVPKEYHPMLQHTPKEYYPIKKYTPRYSVSDSIFSKYSLNDSLDLSKYLSPKSKLKPFHPEKEKLSYHPEKNITRHPYDGMPIYVSKDYFPMLQHTPKEHYPIKIYTPGDSVKLSISSK